MKTVWKWAMNKLGTNLIVVFYNAIQWYISFIEYFTILYFCDELRVKTEQWGHPLSMYWDLTNTEIVSV